MPGDSRQGTAKTREVTAHRERAQHQRQWRLLDDLGCLGEHRRQDGQPERLGELDAAGEVERGRLLDGQIGRRGFPLFLHGHLCGDR